MGAAAPAVHVELSAVVVIGSVDTIVRFEGATALEITPDAPDRMLEHFADLAGLDVSHLLPPKETREDRMKSSPVEC